ncbi:MAG: hypothetical protein ACOYOA_16435 [Saprospiraceae bacterium]
MLPQNGFVEVRKKTETYEKQEVYNLEVGQWHNFLVGSSGVVVHNSCFDNLKIGSEIDRGGEKIVYNIVNKPNLAIGILKDGIPSSKIDDEIALLKNISDQGLPVVPVLEKGIFEGKPALIYERFAIGSKKIVRTKDGVVQIVGNSKLLNRRSIDDLTKIRNKMTSKYLKIDDLQFLIAEDGRIVISDPLKLSTMTTPSDKNLETIDLLIEVAKKNVP